MQDFHKLKVWEKSHRLAVLVYRITKDFPKEELYGLTCQIRRSAMSIPTNIAEGCGREGATELARFLQIAMGSSSELEYQLLLSRDLGFLSSEVYSSLQADLEEIKQMLSSLIQKVRHPKTDN